MKMLHTIEQKGNMYTIIQSIKWEKLHLCKGLEGNIRPTTHQRESRRLRLM